MFCSYASYKKTIIQFRPSLSHSLHFQNDTSYHPASHLQTDNGMFLEHNHAPCSSLGCESFRCKTGNSLLIRLCNVFQNHTHPELKAKSTQFSKDAWKSTQNYRICFNLLHILFHFDNGTDSGRTPFSLERGQLPLKLLQTVSHTS